MSSFFLFLISSFNIEIGMVEYAIIRSILAIFTAFIISLCFSPWLIRCLLSIHIKQYIREEGPKSHYKKMGTPTMGGVLILLPLLISIVLWTDLMNPLIWVILFVLIGFALIGLIDDYLMQISQNNKGLRVKQKFFLQILLATIASYLILLLPNFDTRLIVPFLSCSFLEMGCTRVLFSILVIVGTSNAVNLTDGLDGLAISTVTISKIVYMLIILIIGYSIINNFREVKYVNDILDLAVYCGAFIGSGLGFLWFNASPAQVFMGDTGSLSIGASLGTIAILAKHEVLLVLLGGIFVAETLSVILQVCFYKISKGRRLFNMAPLHHHFELAGISESKIVWRFCIISILLAFLSFLIFKFGYTGSF